MTGKDNGEIDHIELFSKPRNPSAHSRNFVLCPGKSYDRSPCGTGTSAKMACLLCRWPSQPRSSLASGKHHRQHLRRTRIELENNQIIPFVKGSAFVTAQSELVFDEHDEFCWGIPN
jgi:4-hydroxyproline epimerase